MLFRSLKIQPSAAVVLLNQAVALHQAGRQDEAEAAYRKVLEQFPGNPKAPAAQLRKGEAELATNQRDAGVRDLRSLVQRYPQTPEAAQARSRLNGMGVRLTAAKPSAYKQ